jgi:hypothetical protein
MNKKKIVFTNIQLQLLDKFIKDDHLRRIIKDSLDKNKIYESNYATGKSFAVLAENEIELLFNELTYLLTSHGLKNNQELNDFGLAIEEILDLINDQRVNT